MAAAAAAAQRVARAVAPRCTRALAAAAGSSGGSKSEGAMTELYMRAIEPKPPSNIPRMSPEDRVKGTVLAKQYTRLLWRRHNVRGKDASRKLALKWAAIAALPDDAQKREALVVEPDFPLDYRMATDTPPLMGFPGHDDVGAAPEAAAPSAAAPAAGAAAAGAGGGVGAGAAAAAAASAAKAKSGRGGGLQMGTLRVKKRVAEASGDGTDIFGMVGGGVGYVDPATLAPPPPPAAPAAAPAGKGKKK